MARATKYDTNIPNKLAIQIKTFLSYVPCIIQFIEALYQILDVHKM